MGILASYTENLKDIRKQASKKIGDHHSRVTKLRGMKNERSKLENNWTSCVEVDYDEKVLKWHLNEEMAEFMSWPLPGDLV
jgi:hypothetical protein